MPELPEVETVRRSLAAHLVGRRITGVASTVERLRTPLDLPSLERFCCGRRIAWLRRRAKYLLVGFEDGAGLVLHLGMTGAFRVVPAAAPVGLHERVTWNLDDGRSWRFIDPRRFGSIALCPEINAEHPCGLPADLGPEPLGAEFTGETLHQAAQRRDRPVKNLIMDQSVVVGVGNIYASEALFRAGVSPMRLGRRLGRAGARRLADAIRTVLTEAIAAGGTTISDFRDVDGTEGHFRVALAVYGRAGQPCPRCPPPARIQRRVLAGRSSFYCPRCQR